MTSFLLASSPVAFAAAASVVMAAKARPASRGQRNLIRFISCHSRSSRDCREVAELEHPVVGAAARTVVSPMQKTWHVLLIIRSQLSDKWHDSRRRSGFPKATKGVASEDFRKTLDSRARSG